MRKRACRSLASARSSARSTGSLPSLRGRLGERLLLELARRRRPGDDHAVPPVAEQRRELAAQLLAPRRIGIGAAARAGRLGLLDGELVHELHDVEDERLGEGELEVERPAAHLRDHQRARLALLGGEVELLAMAARPVEVGEQGGPGDRHAVLAADLGHVPGREVAADGDLHQAALQLAHHRDERVHLLDGGLAAGHGLAGIAVVADRHRGAEADGAGVHRLAHQLLHRARSRRRWRRARSIPRP